MAFLWIEVVAPREQLGRLRDAVSEERVSEQLITVVEGDRVSLRLLTSAGINRQKLMDRLQDVLEDTSGWRIIVTATQAVTPKTEAEERADERASTAASREEVYETVTRGATLSLDFLSFTTLSTIVAAAGLIMNDVAVIIGSMVIAPLLVPSLAFAFGAAVGDRRLVLLALRAGVVAITIGVGLSLLVPLGIPVDTAQEQISLRSDVELGSIALALASGAAAVLSITSGLSTALVGVMVSAALLPPAVTLGLTIYAAAPAAAWGAGLLLGINLSSVTLAALVTFLVKGVRPRSWHARAGAAQNLRVTIPILGGVVGLMAVLILLGIEVV